MKPSFRQFLEDIEVDRHAYHPSDADDTIETMQRSVSREYDPAKADKPRSVWKKLPVNFPHEGFEVLYKKNSYGEFDIALVDTRALPKLPLYNPDTEGDKHRVAININVRPSHVRLINDAGNKGKFRGLTTDVLSGAKNYRGFGLAPLLYHTLVENGQVLFSSTTQTPGGQSTWRRLVRGISHMADVGVIVKNYDAESIFKRYVDKNSPLMTALKKRYMDTSARHRNDNPDLDDLLEEHEGEFLALGTLEQMDKLAYGRDASGTYWVVAPKGFLDEYKRYAIQLK